jgi:hypothetical protein
MITHVWHYEPSRVRSRIYPFEPLSSLSSLCVHTCDRPIPECLRRRTPPPTRRWLTLKSDSYLVNPSPTPEVHDDSHFISQILHSLARIADPGRGASRRCGGVCWVTHGAWHTPANHPDSLRDPRRREHRLRALPVYSRRAREGMRATCTRRYADQVPRHQDLDRTGSEPDAAGCS